MIEIKNLKKKFNNLEVLKDISLNIKKGEIVSLIGPSGSGKSTLLRCINLLETPTAGEILISGENITDKKTDIMKIREKVGMVFQHFNLFPHMTVLENMIYAPVNVKGMEKDKAIKKAIELLKKIGLEDKKDQYPDKLSGGQKQRVAIVRALIMKPNILLFDEPTSALDPEMVKEVLEVIRELVKTGITMIIVTHEMKFAREVSKRICFLSDGCLLEDSAPEEFFTNPKTDRAKQFLKKML